MGSVPPIDTLQLARHATGLPAERGCVNSWDRPLSEPYLLRSGWHNGPGHGYCRRWRRRWLRLVWNQWPNRNVDSGRLPPDVAEGKVVDKETFQSFRRGVYLRPRNLFSVARPDKEIAGEIVCTVFSRRNDLGLFPEQWNLGGVTQVVNRISHDSAWPTDVLTGP